MTHPSGQTTSLLYLLSPPIFSRFPPLLTDSMIGNRTIINLEQIPCPSALTGQPYAQVYLSPISSPFRQYRSVWSLCRNPVTSISNSYSSSYHFFILRFLLQSMPTTALNISRLSSHTLPVLPPPSTPVPRGRKWRDPSLPPTFAVFCKVFGLSMT